MKKKIILILLILVALSSILFINLGNKSTAQECNDCTPIPTPPGESDYSNINCNCSGATPTIKASASTIAPGGSISLWVDSGGKACPDFTWSVSSAKYTLNKSKTTNDLEAVTMTAASGTCSSGYNDSNVYVTIIVTDKCGISSQVIIINTGGSWVQKETIYSNPTSICPGAAGQTCGGPEYYHTVGNERWRIWQEGAWWVAGSKCNCTTYNFTTWTWDGGSHHPPQGEAGAVWINVIKPLGSCCTTTVAPRYIRYTYYKWECP